MTSTERLRQLLNERGVEYDTHGERFGTWYNTPLGGRVYVSENNAGYLHVKSDAMTPEQAIAATLGNDRLAFLEEKVKLQGDYINKLTKEKNALFAQGCEAATRHAGQIDAMQQKLEAATLGHHLKPWKMEYDTGFYDCMECECGYVSDVSDWAKWHFCPNCGAEVVE